MTYTPPPEDRDTRPPSQRPKTGPSPIWFVLGGIVVAIVVYFLFFTTTPNPGVDVGERPGVTGEIEPSATGEAAPAGGGGPAPIN